METMSNTQSCSNLIPAISAPLAERMLFLRKVYGLLSMSVFIAAVASWMTLTNIAFLSYVIQNFFVFVILEFAVLFFVFWARTKENLGLIALFSFTLLTGITTSPLVYQYQRVVPEALLLTAVAFGGLSLYAIRSNKDFSFLGGMLTTGLIILVVGSLLNAFIFKNSAGNFLFSVMGVFLFSGFILYDTSNILRRYPTNEYISATLSLYLDVLNLFIMLLRVLGGSSRD